MLNLLAADFNPWWVRPASRAAARFPVRRAACASVLQQLTSRDRRAVVVIGPRQVGKTVALLHCIDSLLDHGWPAGNITYFDFSDDRLTGALSAREVVALEPDSLDPSHPRAFFFDEISRASRWQDWLKQTVDRENHRIAVTDSAASMLADGSRESGQGRWLQLRLEGLSYPEFLSFQATPNETLSDTQRRLPNPLERYLFFGGFPEHLTNDSLTEVRSRIREDIADRAIRRDLLRHRVDVERVRDLFVYLVEDSGAIFDRDARSRLLERVGGDRPDARSMEKWVELLLDSMLIHRVDPHAPSATGRLGGRAKPKLYACDPGLIVAFTSTPQPLTSPMLRGQVCEASVLGALRGITTAPVRYLRDRTECDFVVTLEEKQCVVEVTASGNPRDKLQAVRALAKAPSLTVHTGLEHEPQRGVVSLREFLLDPATALREAR